MGRDFSLSFRLGKNAVRMGQRRDAETELVEEAVDFLERALLELNDHGLSDLIGLMRLRQTLRLPLLLAHAAIFCGGAHNGAEAR